MNMKLIILSYVIAQFINRLINQLIVQYWLIVSGRGVHRNVHCRPRTKHKGIRGRPCSFDLKGWMLSNRQAEACRSAQPARVFR